MSDSSPVSPADIISYIGIPLAVLGVIPIFYTFLNSLVTAYNIRRKLRRNAVEEGVTRSSVLSGIVEVEFPRYSITPLERDDADYWTVNPHPTRLKGGSWSIFNWNRMATGKKMYRLQFSEDMQVPQAEVDFDELLSFLIDRGARPDPKGFRLLNMAGLWTPANTSLLLTADQRDSILRVSFPDDSDGILSLSLQWQLGWDKYEGDGLPPHWMRLKDGRPPRFTDIVAENESKPAESDQKDPVDEKNGDDEKESQGEPLTKGKGDQSQFPTSVAIHLNMKAGMPVIDNLQTKKPVSTQSPSTINTNSYILQGTSSNWLAVIATALGTMQGAPIYTIHLPEAFVTLSSRDSLPCGVLVMCGLLDQADAPSWETVYDQHEDSREFHNNFMRQSAAARAESGMAPAQREAAAKLRKAQEFQDFVQRGQRMMHRDKERRERREREAVESSRLSTDVAVQAVLKRLSRAERPSAQPVAGGEGGSELVEPWKGVQSAAETAMFAMLTEEETGKKVCAILDLWKTWIERGGMNPGDLIHLTSGEDTWRYFAYAIIAMALLKVEGTKKESTLALDLQDCVRTWKRVRLG